MREQREKGSNICQRKWWIRIHTGKHQITCRHFINLLRYFAQIFAISEKCNVEFTIEFALEIDCRFSI